MTARPAGIRVLVLFHSWTANTLALAQAIGRGAERVPGSIVEVKRVPELRNEQELIAHENIGPKFAAIHPFPVAALEDVVAADVVFFGSPTKLGSMTAEMKSFIDRLGPYWQKGMLKDKVGAAFATASTPHGGQEVTLMGLLATLMHLGMIIVTPGFTAPIFDIAGAAYGAAAATKPGRVRTPPGSDDLEAAEMLGERATTIGHWVQRGRTQIRGEYNMSNAALANRNPRVGQRHEADDNAFGLQNMDHFALETRNIELMVRFIDEVLGGKPYYYAGFDDADKAAGRVKHVFLRVGNVLVQCAASKDGKVSLDKNNPNVSPHWAFTVTAADLDRNIERLRKLGIPCTDPIQHRGLDVTSAYFQSPEGHKLEICTWEPYPEEKAKHMRIDWPSLAHDWPHGK